MLLVSLRWHCEHHIIFAAISYPCLCKQCAGHTGEANSMRAPCSNCGDRWLPPVRWAYSLASDPAAQCRYSQPGIQWPLKHVTETDIATPLSKQSPEPKSKPWYPYFYLSGFVFRCRLLKPKNGTEHAVYQTS